MLEPIGLPQVKHQWRQPEEPGSGLLRPGRTPHHRVFVQPYLQRNSSLYIYIYFFFFPKQAGAGFLSYQVYLWLPTGQRQWTVIHLYQGAGDTTGQEHWLLFRGPGFSAPTWWLTTISNSCCRCFNNLFWLPRALGTHVPSTYVDKTWEKKKPSFQTNIIFQVESIHRSKLNKILVLCRAISVASMRLLSFARSNAYTLEKDETQITDMF